MEFLQWLYQYATTVINSSKTHNPDFLSYNGYENRLEAYKKQNLNRKSFLFHTEKDFNNHYMQINSHLIPNKAVYRSDKLQQDS